jgi:hypothetical protein
LPKKDFDFDARLVNVRAACAKNSRNDQIPPRPEFAEALRAYMAGFHGFRGTTAYPLSENSGNWH